MRTYAITWSTLTLCLSSVAFAADGNDADKKWDANLGVNYTSYGQHSVGGLTLAGAFARQLKINDMWSARAGVDFAFTGFSDEIHWAAVLGGPMASISVRPWKPDIRITLGASLGIGQMPACRGWTIDVCGRNIGVFPAARIGFDFYTAGPAAISTWFQVRYVNTDFGDWGAPSGGLDARVRF